MKIVWGLLLMVLIAAAGFAGWLVYSMIATHTFELRNLLIAIVISVAASSGIRIAVQRLTKP